MNTEGTEIGKIFLTECQIYQVGIKEVLYILTLQFRGWSEKTVIEADPFYQQPHGNPTATLS